MVLLLHHSTYVAAKGGLRNLTRAMTAEWAGSGLQINGIAPGYVHTEMTQNLVDDEQFNAWILGRTPAHRWGTVQDLAGPAVWLASDGPNFVELADHRRRHGGRTAAV